MGTLHLKKTSTGYNLLGVFSNRWRDWDFHADPEHGGEIVSRAAHEEFAEWMTKNPQHAMELWIWHIWGTAHKSRATWWAFSGNFFYANWPLTDEEGEAIEEWAKSTELGMSFGFYVLDYDWRAASIEKYRAFEASILPVKYAANHWTRIDLVAPPDREQDKGVSKMITKPQYQALVKLHGKEYADELVANDERLAQLLDEAGVESKAAAETEREGQELIAPAKLATPPAAEEQEQAEQEEQEEGTADTAAAETSAAPPAEATADTTAAADESVSQEAVVEALKRLEGAISGDLRALLARVETLERDLSGLKATQETEAKAAALPPSLLAAYAPQSILDRSSEKGEEGSAVIDGRSSLARQAQTAKYAGHPFSALFADIRQ